MPGVERDEELEYIQQITFCAFRWAYISMVFYAGKREGERTRTLRYFVDVRVPPFALMG